MLRNIPLNIYDKYLGHQLSEDEISELSARYAECLENRLLAVKGGCLAAGDTFSIEANYIKDILDGKDLSGYEEYKDKSTRSKKGHPTVVID